MTHLLRWWHAAPQLPSHCRLSPALQLLLRSPLLQQSFARQIPWLHFHWLLRGPKIHWAPSSLLLHLDHSSSLFCSRLPGLQLCLSPPTLRLHRVPLSFSHSALSGPHLLLCLLSRRHHLVLPGLRCGHGPSSSWLHWGFLGHQLHLSRSIPRSHPCDHQGYNLAHPPFDFTVVFLSAGSSCVLSFASPSSAFKSNSLTSQLDITSQCKGGGTYVRATSCSAVFFFFFHVSWFHVFPFSLVFIVP